MTLASRVIACLDVTEGRVVKGVNFTDLVDAGDPVEMAKVYNLEGIDELTFLDISASNMNRATTLDVVARTAEQVFMESFNGIPPQTSGFCSEQRILSSGKGGSTKRSVSETKKKYVASSQEWKCGNCRNQLDHTFEIDHKMRLEYGGGNDVNNLIALCRNCHGKKTASENM